MKRVSLLAAFVGGLAGCAHGRVVMGPDGEPATFVTCHHSQPQKCHVKAQRLCPYGFQVLDAPAGSLVFRCGPYPEPSAPPSEQDPDAPAAPQQPNNLPRVPEEKLYQT